MTVITCALPPRARVPGVLRACCFFVYRTTKLEPVGAKSVSYGAASSTRLDNLSNTERIGRANFMAANASIVLDETNNRFSPTYAPIMDRLLHGDCTLDDLDKINARVIGGPNQLRATSLGMTDCWMAQTITFRNKVSVFLVLLRSFASLHFPNNYALGLHFRILCFQPSRT